MEALTVEGLAVVSDWHRLLSIDISIRCVWHFEKYSEGPSAMSYDKLKYCIEDFVHLWCELQYVLDLQSLVFQRFKTTPGNIPLLSTKIRISRHHKFRILLPDLNSVDQTKMDDWHLTLL